MLAAIHPPLQLVKEVRIRPRVPEWLSRLLKVFFVESTGFYQSHVWILASGGDKLNGRVPRLKHRFHRQDGGRKEEEEEGLFAREQRNSWGEGQI